MNKSPSSLPSLNGDKKEKLFKASTFHLVMLACAIVMKGDVILWNVGLNAGFPSFMLSIMLLSVGYVALIFCLAELNGVAAFAGGSYGYSRCAIGPFWGFLCGCWELFALHIFLVISVDCISECVTLAFSTLSEWELIWCGVVYAIMAVFFIGGESVFWTTMIASAIFSTGLILAYLLGALARGDMYKNTLASSEYNTAIDGHVGFMTNLVWGTWFFIGIESITVANSMIENARVLQSRALPISVLLFVALAFWVSCTGYFDDHESMGDFVDSLVPLAFGLEHDWGVGWQGAYLLCIPPLVSSTLGLMYSVINTTRTMAESGLLPAWFQHTVGKGGIPAANIVLCSIFQYGVFVAGFMPEENVLDMIYPAAVLAACFAYMGILASFLSFKRHFSDLERIFRVPRWLAYVGMAVFAILMISIMGYNEQRRIGVPTFFGLSVLFVVYYCLVVQKRQFFSEEEKKKFLKAYILSANQKRRGRRQQNALVRAVQQCAKALGFWVIAAARGDSSMSGNGSQNRSGSRGPTRSKLLNTSKITPCESQPAQSAQSAQPAFSLPPDVGEEGDKDGQVLPAELVETDRLYDGL